MIRLAIALVLLAGALLRDRPKCHRWQFPGAGVCAERLVTA
jgi:hypothetical protein